MVRVIVDRTSARATASVCPRCRRGRAGDDDLLRWKEEVDETRRAALEDGVNVCR